MRRRLLLFLCVLGVSLALLVVMLQGDPLLFDFEQPTISAQSVSGAEKGFDLEQGSRRISIRQPEQGVDVEYPLRRTVGKGAREHTQTLGRAYLPRTSYFEEGLISEHPRIVYFAEDGSSKRAELTAGRAVVYAEHLSPESFDQSVEPQFQRVVLSEAVRLEVFDPATGDLVGTLETEVADVDLSVMDESESGLPPVRCPEEVVIRAADDSMVLHGSSCKLDGGARRLEFRPPVRVDVDARAFGSPDASNPLLPGFDTSAPIQATAEGPMVYTWNEAPVRRDETQLSEFLGDGLLELDDHVRVTQSGLWFETEHVEARLKRQIDPRSVSTGEEAEKLRPAERRAERRHSLVFRDLRAFDPDESKPVTFGLGSGQGQALRLGYGRASEALVLAGPVDLRDFEWTGPNGELLLVEEAHAEQRLILERHSPGAPGRKEELAESSPYAPAGEHVQLRMVGDARIRLANRFSVGARQLDAFFLPAAKSPKDGPAPASDASGAEVRGGPRFDLDTLHALDAASLSFSTPQGVTGDGGAESILVLTEPERDGHRLELRGSAHFDVTAPPDSSVLDAHVVAPAVDGFVAASALEGPGDVAPAAKGELPFVLEVPALQEGWFTLEPGFAARTGLAGAAASPETDAAPDTPRVLRVRPLETCALSVDQRGIDFQGAAHYDLEHEGMVESWLECGHFEAQEPKAGTQERSVRALGAVHLERAEQGWIADADEVRFGEELELLGTPASFRFALVEVGGEGRIVGDRIASRSDGSSFVADGGPERLAQLFVPASLLASVSPLRAAGRDRAAGSGGANEADSAALASLSALRLEGFLPESPEKKGDLDLRQLVKSARLVATDSVRLEDGAGATLDGARLEADLATGFLRIDAKQGDPEDFVRLQRAVPGSPNLSDLVRTRFLEIEGEGETIELAPASRLSFHHQVAGRWLRIDLTTGDRTRLEGTRLLSEGGVLVDVLRDEGDLHARCERVELLLDRPLQEGGRPLEIRAQRDVLLEHPSLVCRGNLLTFDFVGGWVEMKAGLEPCRVVQAFERLPMELGDMDATFQLLRCRLVTDGSRGQALPFEDLLLKGVRLIAKQE